MSTATVQTNTKETSTALSTWTLDAAHSQASFTVRHMMISNVRGEFAKMDGTLQLDEKNIENSTVEVHIDATTIDTRDAGRDTHLKSADFFDVDNHPTLTFKSKKFESTGKQSFKVVGDLSMRGVTKEVTFEGEGPTDEYKDPWGNQRIAFSATTKVNRKEWGLNWNAALEAGGLLVSEDVKLSIDAQFIKQAAQN